jgi:hypothetical protein
MYGPKRQGNRRLAFGFLRDDGISDDGVAAVNVDAVVAVEEWARAALTIRPLP